MRRGVLALPERHLGLVLPDEVAGFEAVVELAAEAVAAEFGEGRSFLQPDIPASGLMKMLG